MFNRGVTLTQACFYYTDADEGVQVRGELLTFKHFLDTSAVVIPLRLELTANQH